VRYKPKRYLVRLHKEGEPPATERPLTPNDFEVNSIVRDCENVPRKNTCSVDKDKMGVTCYANCVNDFCNGDIPRPTWDDFERPFSAEEKGIPFPDVFNEEDERRKDGPFGGFPPARFPHPGFRPNGRGSVGPEGEEEEEDNEINQRRRPPFPGQYPPPAPFSGLLRPGEFPNQEPLDPRERQRDDREDYSSKRPGGDRRPEGRGGDRPDGNRGNPRLGPGKDKIDDGSMERIADNPSTEDPMTTTPAATKPRRPNGGRGRGRGQKTNQANKLGEAGETSKSQGEKSSSSSAASLVCNSILILVIGLQCFV